MVKRKRANLSEKGTKSSEENGLCRQEGTPADSAPPVTTAKCAPQSTSKGTQKVPSVPTRSSGRVTKRPRRDPSPPQPVPKKPVKEAKPKPKTAARPWALWSTEDSNTFFEGLREHGKDFEAIQCMFLQKHKRGHLVGIDKTKDKIRHFYYRNLHKISKYIDHASDVNKDVLELYSLINYGHVRKRFGFKLSRINGRKLNELVHRGSAIFKLKNKNLRLRTPFCRALKKLNNIEDVRGGDGDEEGVRVPARICVELTPRSTGAWCRVQELAQNPRLRLRLRPDTRLSSVIDFLHSKWRADALRTKDAILGKEGASRPQDEVCLFAAPAHPVTAFEARPAPSHLRAEIALCSYRENRRVYGAAVTTNRSPLGHKRGPKGGAPCRPEAASPESAISFSGVLLGNSSGNADVRHSAGCPNGGVTPANVKDGVGARGGAAVAPSDLRGMEGRLKGAAVAGGTGGGDVRGTGGGDVKGGGDMKGGGLSGVIADGSDDRPSSATVRQPAGASDPSAGDGLGSQVSGSSGVKVAAAPAIGSESTAKNVAVADVAAAADASRDMKVGAGEEEGVKVAEGVCAPAEGGGGSVVAAASNTMNEKVERVRRGVNRSAATDVTAAEVYLMRGAPRNVVLEYDWRPVAPSGGGGGAACITNMLRRLIHLATTEFCDLIQTKTTVSCGTGPDSPPRCTCGARLGDTSPDSKCVPSGGRGTGTRPTRKSKTKASSADDPDASATVGSSDAAVSRSDGIFKIPTNVPVRPIVRYYPIVSDKQVPPHLQVANPDIMLNTSRRAKRLTRGTPRPLVVQRTLLPKTHQPASRIMTLAMLPPPTALTPHPATQTGSFMPLPHGGGAGGGVNGGATCKEDILSSALSQAGIAMRPYPTDGLRLPTPVLLLGVNGFPVTQKASHHVPTTLTSDVNLNMTRENRVDTPQLLDISLSKHDDLSLGGDSNDFSGLLHSSSVGSFNEKDLLPSPCKTFKGLSSLTPDDQWSSAEDFNLSRFLCESPLKRPTATTTTATTTPATAGSSGALAQLTPVLVGECSRDSLSGRFDLDTTLQCMMNESSLDYASKFADLAAQIGGHDSMTARHDWTEKPPA